jgi:site-specific DNA recombinase
MMRQTVLRLAFAEPLRYRINGTYGTPAFAFLFKYLSVISCNKSEMVLPERFELSASPLPAEWVDDNYNIKINGLATSTLRLERT